MNEKYKTSCSDNCSLESELLLLKTSIEETKHKHEVELRNWKDKFDSVNNKHQSQSKSLLDFKEKIEQLSNSNVSEQQKYNSVLKQLNEELSQAQSTSVITEKMKEQLELENLRLSTANKKLTDSLESFKNETRMLKKERGALVREIKSLQTPTDYDKLIGKYPLISSLK